MTPLRRVPCGRCGRQIAWVKTRAGRSMPIDPDPSERGNVFLTIERGAVVAVVVAVSELGKPHEGVPHMPHFATCGDKLHAPPSPPKPERPAPPSLFD